MIQCLRSPDLPQNWWSTMAKYSTDELREAYEHFSRVSDECAASVDSNAFADLFTEDCSYIEHVFGEMHGREAVRASIVPLMKISPNDQMTYTHDWVLFEEERGRVVFCAQATPVVRYRPASLPRDAPRLLGDARGRRRASRPPSQSGDR